ncbi:MAG: hypothetical protein EOO40_01205 [Deltaproteobacteria bacterium]|nr:MAG: hypothetical protein EOO40_01205 [Deltaproteobacteria bacterium]
MKDALEAAAAFLKATGKQYAHIHKATYAKQFLRMVAELEAPFEIRLDGLNTRPVIVVHPKGDRAQGAAAKMRAMATGAWAEIQVNE